MKNKGMVKQILICLLLILNFVALFFTIRSVSESVISIIHTQEVQSP